MPPELLDLLKTVLSHPFFLGGGALALSFAASVLVRSQLTHAGFTSLKLPGLDRLDWASVGGMLAFWVTGLVCAGLMVPQEPLLTLILPLFGVAVKATEAGLVLIVVAWALTALGPDDERKQGEQARKLRQVGVVLGAFVAVAVLSGAAWIPLLLLGALVATVIWLARDPSARTGLSGWVQDIAAGLRLRERWGEGGEIVAEGRTLVLTGPMGLGDTPIREGSEVSRVRNRELARLIATQDALDRS